MRRRLRRGSVLGDFQSGARFGGQQALVPAPPPPGPGVGIITPPMMAPGSVSGMAIAPGSFDITHFASQIRPVAIVGTLPTIPDPNYPIGSHVFLTSDNKLYKNVADAWTKAVDGADIAADSITAGQIAAGAIGASEIAAGAITTEKLTVGILKDDVLLNGGFEDVSSTDATLPAMWDRTITQAGSVLLDTTPANVRSGARSVALQQDAGAGNYARLKQNNAAATPVSQTDVWYLSAWVRADVSATGLYIRVHWGTTPGAQDCGTTDLVSNWTVGTTWTKLEGVVTGQPNAKWAVLEVFHLNPSTTCTKYVDDVTFQKAVGSAQILDASILNAKIANLSVTNLKVADLTLEAGKYKQVRNVIQIPFDDSLESGKPLECFFQMPTGVISIKSVKIWVHQKSFRSYVSTVPSGGAGTGGSGGGQTSSSGGSQTPTSGSMSADHAHTSQTQPSNTGVASPPISDGHWHGYDRCTAQLTSGANLTHTHSVTITAHTHTVDNHQHSTPNHGHTLTMGINEQAAAGNFSVDVSNDGTGPSYVNYVASQVPPINNADLTSGFTTAAGDRRVRINATGLSRAQVLLVMDLILELGAP